MLLDLRQEGFTEATVDHLVAVAFRGLPCRACPFATIPERRLGARLSDRLTLVFWDTR
jgi:hypothetical protein